MGRKNYQAGFSLVKWSVILALLAVAATFLTTKFDPLAELAKLRDKRRMADLEEIASGLANYLDKHSCYPDEEFFTTCKSNVLEPYIKRIPCDPETGRSYIYEKLECDKYIVYTSLKTRNVGLSYNGKGNYVVASPNLWLEPRIEIVNPRYYGCFSGVCQDLMGLDCVPSYFNDPMCWGECGSVKNPKNECQ